MKKQYHHTSFLTKLAARAITNKIVPPKKGIPRSEFGIKLMIGRSILNWLRGK